MIEMAEYDPDSSAVTHMRPLGNFIMRATRTQEQHLVS